MLLFYRSECVVVLKDDFLFLYNCVIVIVVLQE